MWQWERYAGQDFKRINTNIARWKNDKAGQKKTTQSKRSHLQLYTLSSLNIAKIDLQRGSNTYNMVAIMRKKQK